MPKSDAGLLDLNNPVFQDDLFGLGKEEAGRVFAALLSPHPQRQLWWRLHQSPKPALRKRFHSVCRPQQCPKHCPSAGVVSPQIGIDDKPLLGLVGVFESKIDRSRD